MLSFSVPGVMPPKKYSDGRPSLDSKAALNLWNFQIFDLEDIFRDVFQSNYFSREEANIPGVCELFPNRTFPIQGELGLQYPFSDST